MAELSELEEKLAEVYGLAQAAQGATTKVAGLVEDEQITSLLERMHDEAAQTEERCEQLARSCSRGRSRSSSATSRTRAGRPSNWRSRRCRRGG